MGLRLLGLENLVKAPGRLRYLHVHRTGNRNRYRRHLEKVQSYEVRVHRRSAETLLALWDSFRGSVPMSAEGESTCGK